MCYVSFPLLECANVVLNGNRIHLLLDNLLSRRERGHFKTLDINRLGLSDAVASSDSLVFNGRVPMWGNEVYLAIVLL